ncbi:MAG: DNA methyltransferase [Candidatus Aenigmatarchaeota archaeon]
MEYCFILGKNWLLSLSEINNYLKNRNLDFDILEFKKEFAIISIDKLPKNIIDDLGGTIKICQYLSDDLNFFENLIQEKIRIGISVYPKNRKFYENIKKRIKSLLKSQKIKYTFVTPKYRGETSLKHIEVLKKLLKRNGKEIVVLLNDKPKFFLTLMVHDPRQFMIRDVLRPRQRVTYSIPPRLAKILINLVAKPGDVLLDPFCGIGTILQEALLMKIKPIGIDKDDECIKYAKENIEWIKRKYMIEGDVKLINGDATRLSEFLGEKSIDCIATEPYLGPPLKKRPTVFEAEKIIKELEELYLNFFYEAKKVLKHQGKMSVVFPNFLTNDGKEIKIDIEDLCKQSGLKQIELLRNEKTIIDADEKQRTRREVALFER